MAKISWVDSRIERGLSGFVSSWDTSKRIDQKNFFLIHKDIAIILQIDAVLNHPHAPTNSWPLIQHDEVIKI